MNSVDKLTREEAGNKKQFLSNGVSVITLRNQLSLCRHVIIPHPGNNRKQLENGAVALWWYRDRFGPKRIYLFMSVL